MKKLTFSPSICTMWLRRYWVAGALLALVFIFIAVVLNNSFSNLYIRGTQQGVALKAPFIADVVLSYGIHILIAIAAVIVSMLCFGYMKNIRSAIMLHSLPLTRESHFLSVSAAGLCILFAPIVFAAIIFSILQGVHGIYTPGPMALFLFVSLGSALFYFFVSAFIGMLTGNTSAQGLLTVAFLFLPLIVESVIISWCARYLFGYAGGTLFALGADLNPFIQMYHYLSGVGQYYNHNGTLPVLAPILLPIIGLAFAVLAVLLYRIRRIETAGDIIAMKGVRPFFRYLVALGFAMLFSAIFRSAFDNSPSSDLIVIDIVFGVIGGFVGFFIAEMFIRRSVRVFRHFMGGVFFAVAYTAILLFINFDAVGYGRAQLDTASITSISIPLATNSAKMAMKGEPYFSVSEAPDIDLPPTAMEGEPLPGEYADAILKADNSVLKGANMADAVALQNLIARNASALGQTSRIAGSLEYNPYSATDSPAYYVVEVAAKKANGQVFFRTYSFYLYDGQLPELQELYERLYFQHELGLWQNTLETAYRMDSISISISYSYGAYEGWYDNNPGYMEKTVNPRDWDGLLEAYKKDLEAAKDDPPAFGSLEANTVLSLIPTSAYTYLGEIHMDVLYGFQNTLAWLVNNEYLDARALDDYAAAFKADTGNTENWW